MKGISELKEETCSRGREFIYSILHYSLSLLHSEEVLNSLSDTHSKVSRVLPFSIKDTGGQQDSADDMKRLENILSSFNMQQIDVPRDGDCLFSAVVLHLKHVFLKKRFEQ